MSHHKSSYQSHQRRGLAERLQRVRCFGVNRLEVVHSLLHSPTTVAMQERTCSMEYSDQGLSFFAHIVTLEKQRYSELCAELVRFLLPDLSHKADLQYFRCLSRLHLPFSSALIAAAAVAEPS